jgi:hypothetical protein
MISQEEVGGRSSAPAKGGGLALVHPHVLLEAEAFAIGKEERLGEQERGAGQDGRVVRAAICCLTKSMTSGSLTRLLPIGLRM